MLTMSTRRKPLSETSPVRLLVGDYHLRLLSLLLLRPDEDFHLRQIERLTGVPAGPARRELQRFLRAGLVTSRRVGNQVRYRADRGCLVYDELAAMLRKTVGIADVLRVALAPLAKQIKAAFVFGSVAQGKEGPYSDVDLMIVGTASFEDVVMAVHGAEQGLGRRINPVIFRPRDFAAKARIGDGFVRRVLNEPKIMLLGALDEPGKPG